MKLKGRLIFRDNYCYVWTGNHEVNLFSWLASHGLKDKEVEIELQKEGKNDRMLVRETLPD
jgi:hypothetical protein